MREKVKKTRPRGGVLSHDDIRALGDVFRTYPAIHAVYLFGSIGAAKAHHTSDLDLAIVCRSKTLRGKKLALLTDLARSGFCDVDLVFLDTEDIVLNGPITNKKGGLRIEAPRSPRRAITANRQNHWRQVEPTGNALAFAVQGS